MILPVLQVIKYIVKNNPWYKVPEKLCKGFWFQLNKRLRKKVIVKCLFNKQKINLFPDCAVSSLYIYTDIPDYKEIMLLRKKADPESTIFLDVGANIGGYSLCLMDKVIKVFAFEPHPITAGRCRKNFLLNNLSSNQVVQKAVGDITGKAFLSDYGPSSINSIMHNTKHTIAIDTISLGDFAAQNKLSKNNNYLMKVDVEGFEQQVFEGAKSFLCHYDVRAIIFETFGKNLAMICRLLYGFHYQVKKISVNNYIAEKII